MVAGMAIDDSGPCWRMLLNLMETLTTCWKGMVERGRIQQVEHLQLLIHLLLMLIC